METQAVQTHAGEPPAGSSTRGTPLDLVLAVLVLVAALAISLAPHVVNQKRAPADHVYLGLSINAPDQAVYLSWIEQARQGKVALGNMFDAHPAPAKLPNITFYGIGRIAALTGADTRSAYIAARAFALILMLFAAVGLAWALAPDAFARRLTVPWIMLGSGWGAYFIALYGREGGPEVYEKLVGLNWCPADVAIPEFTPVTACANYAHMMIGMALMALSLAFLAPARRHSSIGLALLGGLFALLAGYAHVYDVIVLIAIAGVLLVAAWWRGDRAKLGPLVAYLIPAAIPFVHYVAIFLTDPYLREWSKVPLPSPSPTAYAAGLGTAFVLSALAAHRMRTERLTADDELMTAWVLVQGALLYSGPLIFFERRMCEGYYFAFVVLGAAELSRQLAGRGTLARLAAVVALAATVLPTGLLVNELTARRQPSHRWYFRPAAELDALEQLGRTTTPRDIILADPAVSLFIPGIAGRRVAIGHVDHTKNYTPMVRALIQLLSGKMPREEALSFLSATSATYLFCVALDVVPPPLGPDVLVPVWQNGRYGLFRVVLPR